MNIFNLDEKVQKINKNLCYLDLFNVLQFEYYGKNKDLLKQAYKISNFNKKLDYYQNKFYRQILKLINDLNLDWNNLGFHINYRIKNKKEFECFINCLIKQDIRDKENIQIVNSNSFWLNYYKDKNYKIYSLLNYLEYLEEILDQGYDMSILPINQLAPIEVLKKFLPENDYFLQTIDFNPDPYGLEPNRIVDRETNLIIGTHKFSNSLLVELSAWCPIGCAGCYKSYYTRERGHIFGGGLSENSIDIHSKILVNWLNKNPEVYDIILSGGEPFMINNNKLEILLENLTKAKYLKIVRFCTGVIFLGLPFRINEGLVRILENFIKKTHIRLTVQAHLSNHFQFIPEAIQAINFLKSINVNIYSQVPLQEGINFFINDLDKSLNFLRILGKYQVFANVEPYKYILDMMPRTKKRFVPLELVLKVWSQLGESHKYPELERPKTLSILFKDGNIILSGYMVNNIKKEINFKNKEVIYYIPAILDIKADNLKFTKTYIYKEPLIKGINDGKYLSRH